MNSYTRKANSFLLLQSFWSDYISPLADLDLYCLHLPIWHIFSCRGSFIIEYMCASYLFLGHREPGRNSTNNISMTPDRLSRSSLRHGQYSDEDERKQLSKTREVDTPNRESTRTPLASHGAEKKKKQNQEVVKKKFKADGNENKLEKRKQDIVPKKRLNGKTPSRLPVPCQNQKRKLEISAKPSVKITESTTAVRTKNTVNKIKRNDTSKNIQISNTREKDSAVPKACPTKAGNGKTTKFPRRAPIKGASQENPKLQDTKAKKSFMPTASDGTSKPRSFTTRKQYNHSLPKTVAEAEGLLHLQKEASKATIPTVEPIANSAALPKAVAEGKGLLRLRHKKEESTGDISTAGQDFNSAKGGYWFGRSFCTFKNIRTLDLSIHCRLRLWSSLRYVCTVCHADNTFSPCRKSNWLC